MSIICQKPQEIHEYKDCSGETHKFSVCYQDGILHWNAIGIASFMEYFDDHGKGRKARIRYDAFERMCECVGVHVDGVSFRSGKLYLSGTEIMRFEGARMRTKRIKLFNELCSILGLSAPKLKADEVLERVKQIECEICPDFVRGYYENGTVFVHIEDVACGLGYVYKNGFDRAGKAVKAFAWASIEKDLLKHGFNPPLQKIVKRKRSYYIPLSIALKLYPKCSSECRKKQIELFRAKLVDFETKCIEWACEQGKASPAEMARAWADRYEKNIKSKAMKSEDRISELEAIVKKQNEERTAIEKKYESAEEEKKKFFECATMLDEKLRCLEAEYSRQKEEIQRLQQQNSRLKDGYTISEKRKFWIDTFEHEPSPTILTLFSKEIGAPIVNDTSEFTTGENGEASIQKVDRYSSEVWKRYESFERSIRG